MVDSGWPSILSPQVGLSPESNLGGEVYDREMIRALLRAGARVDVLLPRDAAHPEGTDLAIHRGPRALRYTYEYNYLWLHALNRLARELKPGILRCHSPYALGLISLIIGRRHQIPVVAHYHHLTGERQHDLIDRALACRFDGIVTVSEYTRKQIIEKYGVCPERIQAIPNGITIKTPTAEQIADVRMRHDIGDRPLALSLGQLSARKNVAGALRAFAQVVQKVPEAILLVAGKGSQREELERLAGTLGLASHVRFAGFVSEAEKGAYLGAADVFLFPSLLEGFGLAAAEAMACGTPVVASNRSAIPEVVCDGVTGYLVDPEDIEAMAGRIVEILVDAGLHQNMGEAAQAYAREHFSWDRVALQVLDIYRNLASNVVHR